MYWLDGGVVHLPPTMTGGGPESAPASVGSPLEPDDEPDREPDVPPAPLPVPGPPPLPEPALTPMSDPDPVPPADPDPFSELPEPKEPPAPEWPAPLPEDGGRPPLPLGATAPLQATKSAIPKVPRIDSHRMRSSATARVRLIQARGNARSNGTYKSNGVIAGNRDTAEDSRSAPANTFLHGPTKRWFLPCPRDAGRDVTRTRSSRRRVRRPSAARTSDPRSRTWPGSRGTLARRHALRCAARDARGAPRGRRRGSGACSLRSSAPRACALGRGARALRARCP